MAELKFGEVQPLGESLVNAANHNAGRRSHVSPDFPGRLHIGDQPQSQLDGVLGGALGARHADGRELRIQGPEVVGYFLRSIKVAIPHFKELLGRPRPWCLSLKTQIATSIHLEQRAGPLSPE